MHSEVDFLFEDGGWGYADEAAITPGHAWGGLDAPVRLVLGCMTQWECACDKGGQGDQQ